MSIYHRNLDPDTPPENVYGLVNTDFECNSLEVAPHTHDNYNEFFLVTKGTLCHVVNGKQQAVSEMQLCFVRSTDVHAMTTYGYDGYASFFNVGIPAVIFDRTLKFFNSDFEKQFKSELSPVVTLNVREYKSLVQKIDNFQSVPFGEYHGQIFMNMVSDMIFYLLKPNSNSMFEIVGDAPEWFLTLVNSMNEQENFTVGISRMKDIVNYSQEHINRAFKKYMDITPTEYVNTLRVSYAKKLITENEMNAIEACYASGFKTLGHFYQVFKQYYGMSPMQLLKLENHLI